MKRWRGFLLVILFILLLIIPKVIFSINGVSDPHIYSSIVPAQISLNKEKILDKPFEKNMANTLNEHTNSQAVRVYITSIQVILSKISGLDLKKINFVPFNSIILALLAYVIANLIFKNNFYSFAIAFFLMYEPVIGYLTNTPSEHGFGYVFYFTSIIIFLKMQEHKENRLIGIPIFILLFISALLTYYTIEFYLIILSLSFYFILFISSKIKYFYVDSYNYIYTFKLPLILMIIFFMFDDIPSSYISERLKDRGNQDFLSYTFDFFHSVFNQIIGNAPDIKQSTYMSGVSNYLAVWAGLLLYLSLLLPIVVYLFYFLWKSFTSKKINITLQTLFFFTALITGFADVMIYLLIGFMSLKYILLVFPFLTFYSIDKLIKSVTSRKKIIIFILFLCVVKFSVDIYTGQEVDRSYRISDPTTKWFTDVVEPETNILTDLEFGGKILIEAAINNKNINVFVFRYFKQNETVVDENVMFLYSNNSIITNEVFNYDNYNYLIIRNTNLIHPIMGLGWMSFPPIGGKISYLNNCTTLNRIYQDDNVFIYKLTA